jgi:hypothetical protein
VSTSDIGGHHAGRYPSAIQGGMASRLPLILSHVGLGHHQWIEQWALADRP